MPEDRPARASLSTSDPFPECEHWALRPHSPQGLFYTIRLADGTWPQPFEDVIAAVLAQNPGSIDPGWVDSVPCAAVFGELYVMVGALPAPRRILYTIRHVDGTWGPFGDVVGSPSPVIVGPSRHLLGHVRAGTHRLAPEPGVRRRINACAPNAILTRSVWAASYHSRSETCRAPIVEPEQR
jgi:hypothetical protein